MPRHIDIIIDGVPLSSAGPFLIHAVHEDAPTIELTEGERPGRPGTLLLNRKRQQLKVAAEINIRELYNLAARSNHMEQLAAWAHGLNGVLEPPEGAHYLQLTSRPFRRLRAVCTAEPTLGETRNYASAARVEFTAYTVPFWEDITETRWTMERGQTGTMNLIIPGTGPAPVCLTVTPVSTITSFSVTVGDQTVSLTGLSVSTPSTLVFGRDVLDNLSVYSGNTMLLSKRTAASADDLITDPGPVALSYTANASVDVSVSVRGRYL